LTVWPPDRIRRLFDEQVAAKRFSMPELSGRLVEALEGSQASQQIEYFRRTLGRQAGTHVYCCMIRTAFLIELVKQPKIETTKFEVRWAERLDQNDPRRATFDECLASFENLMGQMRAALDNRVNTELVQLFFAHSLLPYELPVDYGERRADAPIHRAENIMIMWDDLPRRVVRLRAFLLNRETNPHARFFEEAYDKIKVKTYLTDRALTGDHKTNREKRWETHPASVQFALRRGCMEIEDTLVNQLCYFEGFPDDLRRNLDQAALLVPLPGPFRCPITMEPLSFVALERELLNPQMGKASFQVGHLNPLKAVNDDPRQGHTAQNISWISSDGNRIQGHLSLEETRALVRRISENYERSGVAGNRSGT
jgi:hypothetical protein